MKNFKYISLNKGNCTIVDNDEYEKFGNLTWFICNGYAKRSFRLKSVERSKSNRQAHLHREILNAPKGMCIDHINGDKLDNRKSNLRLCTNQENIRNSKVMIKNTSGFKGVSWMKSKSKWRARIKVNMREIHLGLFASKLDAVRCYNKGAKRYFSDFAYINKVI